jgi:ribosomal protein S18 acetylase RimI-like enzyme
MPTDPRVRRATADDAAAAARLMHDFSTAYDEGIDGVEILERRYRDQLQSGDLFVLIGGRGPDGFAQVRLKGQIYSDALDACLEELFVYPDKRGQGLGRALLEGAMQEARERGADHIDLGTSEDDTQARGLYESMGFTNREGNPDGPVMLYYERDLD